MSNRKPTSIQKPPLQPAHQSSTLKAGVNSNRNGTAVAVQAKAFSGPIPDPEYLKAYAEIDPSIADRIVAMAEKEQAHRHALENQQVDLHKAEQLYHFKEGRLGQVLALLVTILFVGATVFLAYNGKGTVAAVLGSATMLGLVSVFIAGRYKRENKQQNSETTKPNSKKPSQ